MTKAISVQMVSARNGHVQTEGAHQDAKSEGDRLSHRSGNSQQTCLT